MKNAFQYRALASLYRQQAAYNPAQKWHLLGQAERWEHPMPYLEGLRAVGPICLLLLRTLAPVLSLHPQQALQLLEYEQALAIQT